MEQFLFVFIHLALPVLLLIDFIFRKSKSKIGLIIRTILYLAIIFFLYTWGQWPLVGTYYLRYVMIAFLILLFFLGWKSFSSIHQWKPLKLSQRLMAILTGIFAVLVLTMNYNALKGKNYPEGGVNLDFPLKNGTFYVASGGSSKIINNHMRSFPNAQEYALDINKLGKFGGASKTILSHVNTDHYIFSDTVYCPCNGKILEIKEDIQDNSSGSMNVSPEDGTGNFVNIHCDQDFFVFIPHLKQNSVFVSKDMLVKTGTPLGLIGISGFAQEPHLHLQAAKYNSDSVLIGVPMILNGQMLYRNDRYKN